MVDTIKFKLNYKPPRQQAKNWLKQNIKAFPTMINEIRSEDLFNGWRFIRSLDKTIYFANCIDAGIDEFEFKRNG